MASFRISVRIDAALEQRLRQESAFCGKAESDVVREALEQYFSGRQEPQSCYDIASRTGVIGSAKGLPADLSTNPSHFDGCGE